MNLTNFITWIIISVSLTSSLMIGNLWFSSTKYAENSNPSKQRKRDKGLLYLACALFVWGVSGLIHEFPDALGIFKDGTYKIVLSSLNSFFLIVATYYFEFSPAWIKNNRKRNIILFNT